MKMKLFVLIFLLIGGSFIFTPVSASALMEVPGDDSDPKRPEDYLLHPDNIPETMFEKYTAEDFRIGTNIRRKLPNFYQAEITLLWGDDLRITTSIMVVVPGYWEGYNLKGDENFGSVTKLEGIGEYALLLESTYAKEVHFFKGNSLVKVSAKGGGDKEDVQIIAHMIASQLPDELPHPDTWQIEVPEPAREITLPSKYVYDIYKDGEVGIVEFDKPDHHTMHILTRYPFTQFTRALWNVELQSYIYLEEVEPSMFEYRVLAGEHGAQLRNITWAPYEMHYWVNGEFSAIYPFEMIEPR